MARAMIGLRIPFTQYKQVFHAASRNALGMIIVACMLFVVGSGLLRLESCIPSGLWLSIPQWLGHNPCKVYPKGIYYSYELAFGLASGLCDLPVLIIAMIVLRRAWNWRTSFSKETLGLLAASATYSLCVALLTALNSATGFPESWWYALTEHCFPHAYVDLSLRRFAFASMSAIVRLPCVCLACFVFIESSNLADGANESKCNWCDYCLRGNSSGRCPECGTIIPPNQRIPSEDIRSRGVS